MTNTICQKCLGPDYQGNWDCICEYLIDMGNCPNCMNIPEKCNCVSSYPVTPEGYYRVVHDDITEFIPHDFPSHDS